MFQFEICATCTLNVQFCPVVIVTPFNNFYSRWSTVGRGCSVQTWSGIREKWRLWNCTHSKNSFDYIFSGLASCNFLKISPTCVRSESFSFCSFRPRKLFYSPLYTCWHWFFKCFQYLTGYLDTCQSLDDSDGIGKACEAIAKSYERWGLSYCFVVSLTSEIFKAPRDKQWFSMATVQ